MYTYMYQRFVESGCGITIQDRCLSDQRVFRSLGALGGLLVAGPAILAVQGLLYRDIGPNKAHIGLHGQYFG